MCTCRYLRVYHSVCVFVCWLQCVCLHSFSSLGKAGCTWPLIISTEPEYEPSDSVRELVHLKSSAILTAVRLGPRSNIKVTRGATQLLQACWMLSQQYKNTYVFLVVVFLCNLVCTCQKAKGCVVNIWQKTPFQQNEQTMPFHSTQKALTMNFKLTALLLVEQIWTEGYSLKSQDNGRGCGAAEHEAWLSGFQTWHHLSQAQVC